MGNWRTVNITGTIDAAETTAVREHLAYDYDDTASLRNFGPLSFNPHRPSLAGIGDWVNTEVSARGNLAERDYDVEDVAKVLRHLVILAPSMDLKVHCGDDWESTDCIATITVSGGRVEVGPPEVPHVAPVSDGEVLTNLLANLTRQTRTDPPRALPPPNARTTR
jgi:Tfp pilus assembly protein FimT